MPFGNSGRPICQREQILEFAKLLRSADLQVGDFESRINLAANGDVVYADPPYTTLGANNGFIRYNEHLFSWTDQKRLADAAKRARARGVFVAVSGLWHSGILMLYEGWWASKFTRMVCVSREANARKEVSEVLLFSRKPKNSAGSSLVRLGSEDSLISRRDDAIKRSRARSTVYRRLPAAASLRSENSAVAR